MVIPIALAASWPRAWSALHRWQLRRKDVPALEAIVRRAPSDVEARYSLGLAYANAGRYKEGSQEFLLALQKDPVRADILNDLGVAYLLQDRFYEALVALQGALAAQPNFRLAYANLGRLHLATHMPFTAEREFSRAVRLGDRDPDLFCDLGEAHQRTLNFKGSIAAYQHTLRLSPNHLRAWIGLGRAYTRTGDLTAAERALRRAVELAPGDDAALEALGQLEMDRAVTDTDLQQARQIFERAARAEPGDAEAWYYLGKIDLRQGRPRDAVQRLSQALRMSPQYTAAIHELELALRADGRVAEADRAGALFHERALREREETRLEERVNRVPGDWDAKERLAELYLQSGKRAMAVLIYRQLKEGKPDHPRLPVLIQALNPPSVPPVPPALLQGGR